MPRAWTTFRRRALGPVTARVGNAVLDGRGVLANRFLSAKLIPLAAHRRYALLERPEPGELHLGLPVPPKALWQRWGTTLDEYLAGGRQDVERMLADLTSAGVAADSLERVLDLGCAEGRMLRFFPGAGERELWGVDVNAERIAWCQQNLTPPLSFATTTTAPHLPFADNSFDLVYGISVFTHISELADAWFLELLRVLRPGGHAYLTIHDEHSVELLLDTRGRWAQSELARQVRRFDEETAALSREWVYFAIDADPGAQVFFNAGDLTRRWSQLAELAAVNEAAIGYQTALVFQKRGT